MCLDLEIPDLLNPDVPRQARLYDRYLMDGC